MLHTRPFFTSLCIFSHSADFLGNWDALMSPGRRRPLASAFGSQTGLGWAQGWQQKAEIFSLFKKRTLMSLFVIFFCCARAQAGGTTEVGTQTQRNEQKEKQKTAHFLPTAMSTHRRRCSLSPAPLPVCPPHIQSRHIPVPILSMPLSSAILQRGEIF